MTNSVWGKLKIHCWGRRCLRGDQERDDWGFMTGFMEVLEIQRVVPDLIDCAPLETRLADFEFDDKYHRTAHEYGIDSSTHSGNVEFEVNGASKAP
jgi:hypothetical protein